MLTVVSLIAPIVILAIAVAVGVVFNFTPVRQRRHKLIPLIIFAGAVSVVGLVVTFFLTNILTDYLFNFPFMENFASLFQEVGVDLIKYNPQISATLILLGTLEVGLGLGFGTAYRITTIQLKLKPKDSSKTVDSDAKIAKYPTMQTATNMLEKENETESVIAKNDPHLRRDERSMIELFLYEKVSQIVPTVDTDKPEGYFFDIPQLDWDTKHTSQVLDALLQKKFLKAELIDKLIVCRDCDSAKVRVIKSCPECGSLRLRKEGLIEHFSCGAVDRRSAFETPSGDLVCPKCKAELHLIGSDYSVLPSAYKCLACNTLNNQPRLIVKCSECSASEDFDDEREILLYKYTADPQMTLKELQNIKRVEKTAEFFKSLGYAIVAPAYIKGKSGAQHIFDMLFFGKVCWIENQLQNPNAATNSFDNKGNTVVEVIASSKLVSLAEITRINCKTSDIENDFLLFAIPGLTPNARKYAKAYNIKVIEGKDIEAALANSKIPKVKSENA